MSAAHYKLDNLIAIVDLNGLQITGKTGEVCSNEPLDEKFKAFGWSVRTVNGHDVAALTEVLESPLELGKPSAVLARTHKGRGVSFMEDVVKWHHKVPNDEDYTRAMGELDQQIATLEDVRS